MQQDLKFEAYRMEAVRKTAESVCFERCVERPAGVLATLRFALPTHVPLLQSAPDADAATRKSDLTDEQALCVDRCAWKFMQTSKIVTQSLTKAKASQMKSAGMQGGGPF